MPTRLRSLELRPTSIPAPFTCPRAQRSTARAADRSSIIGHERQPELADGRTLRWCVIASPRPVRARAQLRHDALNGELVAARQEHVEVLARVGRNDVQSAIREMGEV
jgi:hypothetical protein